MVRRMTSSLIYRVFIEYDFRQGALVDKSVGRYLTKPVEILGSQQACGFHPGLCTPAHIYIHSQISTISLGEPEVIQKITGPNTNTVDLKIWDPDQMGSAKRPNRYF